MQATFPAYEVPCQWCGFYFPPVRQNKKYCSEVCSTNFHKRKLSDSKGYIPAGSLPKRPCAECQTEFQPMGRRGKFCCDGCKYRWSSRDWRTRNPERDKELNTALRQKARATSPWVGMVKSARIRSREIGLDFDLTEEWARDQWTGKCEVTGIAFDLVNGTIKERMRSPSIDRIDNNRGYTKDNVRFVLWAVNAIKGTGTDAEMLEVAKAIVGNFSIT